MPKPLGKAPSFIVRKRKREDDPLDALVLESGTQEKKTRDNKGGVYKRAGSLKGQLTEAELKERLSLASINKDTFGGVQDVDMADGDLLKALTVAPLSPEEHSANEAGKQGEDPLYQYLTMTDEYIKSLDKSDDMDCKDGDHWDYFVPHIAEAGQENFLDGKSWATVVGEVDTDEFDFAIPEGYGHGEANEFLGQEDNMDEDNEDDIDYPDEEDNDLYETQVSARAPKKLQRDFSTASVFSVAEEDPEAAELADLIKDYSKPGGSDMHRPPAFACLYTKPYAGRSIHVMITNAKRRDIKAAALFFNRHQPSSPFLADPSKTLLTMPILYPPSLIACKRRLKDGPLDALLLNSGEPGKESREPKVVYKLSASVGNGVTLKDLKGQLRLFLLDLEFFGGGAIDNVEAEMTEEALLKVLNLKPNSPSTSDEHVTSDARKQGGQVEKHPYLSLGESEKNLRLYIEDDPTLWEMHDEFIDSGMSGPNGFYWDFFLPLTPEAEQEDFLDGKSWSNVFAYMDQDDEEEVEGKATPVNLDNDEVEPDGGDTTGNAHPVARTAQTKRTFTSSELRKSHVLSARGVSSLLYSHTQPPRAEDLWIPSFSLGSLFDQIDARDEAEWLSSD
ncbi:uncharacterized protein SCHCODRAFT_01085466 [Schizophyllum commune H4-8]|nr:uncharacterized protein SCHCODRAFT_01085466 [Schizophyllum commune H4-8]KAI5900272.1 hypothetical protein SCHCODRAFT_01085466 [Schizophyllum commune H4-8]